MKSFTEESRTFENLEYLTKKQVACLLQVSLRSIEAYSAKENLPTIRISSRKVLYPRNSVMEWLKARQKDI